jgi:hypothetical protein
VRRSHGHRAVHKLPEVDGPLWVGGLVRLLGLIPGPGQVAVQQAGHQLVRRQGPDGAASDPVLPAPRVVGGVHDGPGDHLGLVDGRDRAWTVGLAVEDPVELGGVLTAGSCTIMSRTLLRWCSSSQRSASVKPSMACLAPQ